MILRELANQGWHLTQKNTTVCIWHDGAKTQGVNTLNHKHIHIPDIQSHTHNDAHTCVLLCVVQFTSTLLIQHLLQCLYTNPGGGQTVLRAGLGTTSKPAVRPERSTGRFWCCQLLQMWWSSTSWVRRRTLTSVLDLMGEEKSAQESCDPLKKSRQRLCLLKYVGGGSAVDLISVCDLWFGLGPSVCSVFCFGLSWILWSRASQHRISIPDYSCSQIWVPRRPPRSERAG